MGDQQGKGQGNPETSALESLTPELIPGNFFFLDFLFWEENKILLSLC